MNSTGQGLKEWAGNGCLVSYRQAAEREHSWEKQLLADEGRVPERSEGPCGAPLCMT